MSAENRDIILLDSESDLEPENPAKRPKVNPQEAVPWGPTALPPMKKPFMEDSDESPENLSEGSSESNSETSNLPSAGISHASRPATVVVDGIEYYIPQPSVETYTNAINDDSRLDLEGLNEADPVDAGLMPESNESDDSDSESDVEPSLIEVETQNLLNLGVGGDLDAETKARQKCIFETRKFVKEHSTVEFLRTYFPLEVTTDVIIDLILKLGFVPRNLPPIKSGQTYIKLMELLSAAIRRVRKLRPRLENFTTVPDVLEALRKSQRILVITGAGISTSLGIPDFRSSEGFYSKMSSFGLDDPQDVFNINEFKLNPNIFYSIAHMLLPPAGVKAPLHKFLKLLQDKGKLLRNYTQNIDNLEKNAGILPDKMVQCHGSIDSATCITCRFQTQGSKLYPAMLAGEVAYCPRCNKERKKRLRNDEGDFDESFGVMKPDITFFGEGLPRRFHQLHKQDLLDCDLLISIGTSLRVAPVSLMVEKVRPSVPQILINRDPISDCNFDVSFLGYCDDAVSYLCDQLGEDWKIDHPEYPEIVGKDHRNLVVEPTEEIGVFQVRNARREAEAANAPNKAPPVPDCVMLEPTL